VRAVNLTRFTRVALWVGAALTGLVLVVAVVLGIAVRASTGSLDSLAVAVIVVYGLTAIVLVWIAVLVVVGGRFAYRKARPHRLAGPS
jgi:hypothetical protein